MKFTIHLILFVLICLLVPMYSNWLYMAPLGALVGFFIPYRKTISSFAYSFLFSFLTWSGAAAMIAIPNDMILAERVGGILNISGTALILVTGLIAGLFMGLSAASGHSFKQIFKK
ncbi:MAG: hypothetical protein P8P48_05570 [Saprospiraceae bacterium]|nr:hypothetical protein [Saprospiraceae bacterium]